MDRRLVALVGACMLAAPAAYSTAAVSAEIVNEDDATYTLTVRTGKGADRKSEELKIEKGAKLEKVCATECSIKLRGLVVPANGTSKFVIRHGMMTSGS